MLSQNLIRSREKKIRKIKDAVNGCIIEDPEIDKIFTYLTCAMEFGWTSQETDSQDKVLLEGLMIALRAVREREQREINSGR